MSSYVIPAASAARLRAKYEEFEAMAVVVAEAMGLDPSRVVNVNVKAGSFETSDPDPIMPNGVAEEGVGEPVPNVG